jgi:diguanylate cyclase (GGDEF)-like protein/PAS domain S-box-containing protein
VQSFDDDVLFDAASAPRHAWLQSLKRRLRQVGSTLKLRLALGTLVLLWTGMALTAAHLSQVAAEQTLRDAAQREQDQARHAAAALGRRLAALQQAIALAATELQAGERQDDAEVAAFLERQHLLRAQLASLFAVRPDGSFVSFVDAAGARLPAQPIADRPYFQRLQSSGRAVVSEAVLGRVSGEPVVVLAHPWRWPDGRLGAVGGALRLASRDLLQDLLAYTGADDPQRVVTVVTDAAGTVLAHPHRARLLQPLGDLGLPADVEAALSADRAVAWSTDTHVVAAGVDPAAGWRVWRLLPREAALAPARAAQQRAQWVAAWAALALTALLTAFLHWQLGPLAALRRSAQALRDGAPQDAWPAVDGEIGEVVRTLRHVWAERTQVESFNQQVLERLHSVMAAAPVGLAFARHGRFELVSAECCALLGRGEEALVGQLTRHIFAANADYEAIGVAVGRAFEAGQPYVGEWRLLRTDGTEFWARLRARPVVPGEPAAGTIWSINDISDQVAARARLEHAALHDALTGLSNRKGFELQLSAVLARREEGHSAAVLMLDLDGFKPVNDTHGHAAGDAVLVAVAQALTSQVRASDVVARMGGDEFAVLLPACERAHALRVAEKARRSVAGIVLPWQGAQLRVGVSVGVAMLQAEHADGAQWLAAADAACYAAKRGGRNRVRSSQGDDVRAAATDAATAAARDAGAEADAVTRTGGTDAEEAGNVVSLRAVAR